METVTSRRSNLCCGYFTCFQFLEFYGWRRLLVFRCLASSMPNWPNCDRGCLTDCVGSASVKERSDRVLAMEIDSLYPSIRAFLLSRSVVRIIGPLVAIVVVNPDLVAADYVSGENGELAGYSPYVIVGVICLVIDLILNLYVMIQLQITHRTSTDWPYKHRVYIAIGISDFLWVPAVGAIVTTLNIWLGIGLLVCPIIWLLYIGLGNPPTSRNR